MTVKIEDVSYYTSSLDCVHCGLCLQACPTYNVLGLETDSPRGRIYMMRALAEGRVESPEAIRPHLDQCLDCRACESACPSGVRYGEILETVRADLEKKQPRRGFVARLRGFLLAKVLAHQGRLRFAFKLGRLAQLLGLRRLAFVLRVLPRHMDALLPPIPAARDRAPLVGKFEPKGKSRGTVALFTGCVMEQLFGAINRATRDVLVANGFTVVVPDQQVCCGALHVHDGHPEVSRQLAQKNISAFAGFDRIVNNSAGCGCALKEYGHLLGTKEATEFSARCRDWSEVLHEQGLSVEPAKASLKVAYDDPCHLCHGQGVRKAPRALLARVPGLELVSHPSAEDCCGSAGIYNLTQPDLAREIGVAKAKALIASGAQVVATGNPGCMLQIRAHLRMQGSDIAVVHPVELLLSDAQRGEPPAG